jgi:hypothetical protein
MIRLTALVVVALSAIYGAYAFAQERAQMRSAVTALTPIASSSATDSSFAWFYDAANRTVYVCRASGNPVTVDCKGKTELP